MGTELEQKWEMGMRICTKSCMVRDDLLQKQNQGQLGLGTDGS